MIEYSGDQCIIILELSVFLTLSGTMQWAVLPRWQPQRIQMSFPLTSSNTTAVAMLEAKKIWGRHLFKLLAVDVPSKAPLGSDTRIFVRGSAQDFEVEESGESRKGGMWGGWWGGAREEKIVRGRVFEELRDPLKRVMRARKAVEVEDEEDERKLHALEQQRLTEEALKRAAKAPKPLDEGGGMYVHEYLYWQMYYGLQKAGKWLGRKDAAS